jgi:antitoxin PrlF
VPRATITSKGQMTIPKEIRELLGLQPGDRVEFIPQSPDSVLLRPASLDISRLDGLLAGKTDKVVSVEEMNEAIRRRFGRK